jgi:hypothetical protein
MRLLLHAIVLVCLAVVSIPRPAAATLITTTDPVAFAAQVSGGFTLVNLDAPPLNAFASGYHVEDALPAAAFSALGIDFVGVNATVLAGQNGQITTPGRDRLILNGSGFNGTLVNNGEIVINLLGSVNGVGGFSNVGDGGRILAYSGPGGTGTLLGQTTFANGGFGGLILTSDVIASVQFTCDFNSDKKCGVYDIQFGRVSAVPEPVSGLLTLAGLGTLAACRALSRRRHA